MSKYVDPDTGQVVEVTRLAYAEPDYLVSALTVTLREPPCQKGSGWSQWKKPRNNTPKHLREAYREQTKRDRRQRHE